MTASKAYLERTREERRVKAQAYYAKNRNRICRRISQTTTERKGIARKVLKHLSSHPCDMAEIIFG